MVLATSSGRPNLLRGISFTISSVPSLRMSVSTSPGAIAFTLTLSGPKSEAISLVRADNADNHNYQNTLLILRNENLDAIELVGKSFGIAKGNKTAIQTQPDESLGLDLTIIIGKDIHSYSNISDFIATKN